MGRYHAARQARTFWESITGINTMSKLLLISAFQAFLVLCGARLAYTQVAGPRFEDFPVKEVFKGKSARIRLLTSQDKEYATRLHEAASRAPNFAGHYILAAWGCGASCVMAAALDARTGRVLWLPFTVCCWDADVSEPMEFKRDSSLIVIHGSRNETGGGTYYYRLEAGGFVLVKEAEKAKKNR